MTFEAIILSLHDRYKTLFQTADDELFLIFTQQLYLSKTVLRAALEELEDSKKRARAYKQIAESDILRNLKSEIALIDRIKIEMQESTEDVCQLFNISFEEYVHKKSAEIGAIFYMINALQYSEITESDVSCKLKIEVYEVREYMCRFFARLIEEAMIFRYRVLKERLQAAGEADQDILRVLISRSAANLDYVLEAYLHEEE